MKTLLFVVASIALLVISPLCENLKTETKQDVLTVISENEGIQVEIGGFKDFYINGERVTPPDRRLVYNGEIYISMDVLNAAFNHPFAVFHDGVLQFRRAVVTSGQILEHSGQIYIPLQLLSRYVHVNEDALDVDNVLYIDTSLPSSLPMQDGTFVRTGEIQAMDSDTYGEPDGITEDGRGYWRNGDFLWVEDDLGFVVQFGPDGNTIA